MQSSADPSGVTEKMLQNLRKRERKLIVAFQLSPTAALPAAENLKAFLEKRTWAKAMLSDDTTAALAAVQRELAASKKCVAAIDPPRPPAVNVYDGVVSLGSMLAKAPSSSTVVSLAKSKTTIAPLEETSSKRENRAARFDGSGPTVPQAVVLSESGKSHKRSLRADILQTTKRSKIDDGDVDTSWEPVVGTSLALEKPFFRLTSAPKPHEVLIISVKPQYVSGILCQQASEYHNYPLLCRCGPSLSWNRAWST